MDEAQQRGRETPRRNDILAIEDGANGSDVKIVKRLSSVSRWENGAVCRKDPRSGEHYVFAPTKLNIKGRAHHNAPWHQT